MFSFLYLILARISKKAVDALEVLDMADTGIQD